MLIRLALTLLHRHLLAPKPRLYRPRCTFDNPILRRKQHDAAEVDRTGHLRQTPTAHAGKRGIGLLERVVYLGDRPTRTSGVGCSANTRCVDVLLAFSKSRGSSTAPVKKKKLLMSAAHDESNTGLKGGSHKGKAVVKRGGGDSGDEFKVTGIIVLACGTQLQFLKNVRSLPPGKNKIPSLVKFQHSVLQGLAIFNTKGITVNRNADHDEVVDWLTNILPLPFTYFDRIQRESTVDEPAWVLLSASRQHLDVVPLAKPTGADLDFFKGNASQGFRTHYIYIASRAAIPDELLTEWADLNIASFVKPSKSKNAVEDSEDESGNSDASDLSSLHIGTKRACSDDDEGECGPVKKDAKTVSDTRRSSARLAGKKSTIDLTKDSSREGTPERSPEFLTAPSLRSDASASTAAVPSPTRSQLEKDMGNPYAQKDFDF
ncbi:hypothetical protein MKEN_00715000 [Mycena kentingensis (nom. inval.)]|nr:hypothetical protein MKEN_00715000 [Mycena kentingensis (nom. inval.)]